QIQNQQVTLGTTSGSLAFTSTTNVISGGGWLTVSPTSGTTPATINFSANAISLPVGTYQANVSFMASGVPTLVYPVTFVVSSNAVLTATPSQLSFTSQSSQTPNPQQFQVTGSGQTVFLQANATTSTSVSWLSVTPTSSNTPGTFVVSANPAGL